jgi:hypothetical protein
VFQDPHKEKDRILWPGVIARAYNPSYSGGDSQVVQDKPGPKVNMIPISTNKPGIVMHICNPSYVGGIGSRIPVLGILGQKCKTLSVI